MIVMGRVLAPYGVKGWIKVRPYSAEPNALIGHRRWWLAKTGEEWREFALIEEPLDAPAVTRALGRVTELLETPAHAVLRVEDESGREELIPLVSAYVDTIELQHRRIVVDWHRGNA